MSEGLVFLIAIAVFGLCAVAGAFIDNMLVVKTGGALALFFGFIWWINKVLD